jgi:hypothetical protein
MKHVQDNNVVRFSTYEDAEAFGGKLQNQLTVTDVAVTEKVSHNSVLFLQY